MVEAPDVDAASSVVRKQWCKEGAWPVKSRGGTGKFVMMIDVGRSGVNSQSLVGRLPEMAIQSRWACVYAAGLSFEVVAETMST